MREGQRGEKGEDKREKGVIEKEQEVMDIAAALHSNLGSRT